MLGTKLTWLQVNGWLPRHCINRTRSNWRWFLDYFHCSYPAMVIFDFRWISDPSFFSLFLPPVRFPGRGEPMINSITLSRLHVDVAFDFSANVIRQSSVMCRCPISAISRHNGSSLPPSNSGLVPPKNFKSRLLGSVWNAWSSGRIVTLITALQLLAAYQLPTFELLMAQTKAGLTDRCSPAARTAHYEHFSLLV